MDVLIPLLAFLAGLGAHGWRGRLRRARVRDVRVRARVDLVLLDAEALAEHLQGDQVRREIEELIQGTRR